MSRLRRRCAFWQAAAPLPSPAFQSHATRRSSRRSSTTPSPPPPRSASHTPASLAATRSINLWAQTSPSGSNSEPGGRDFGRATTIPEMPLSRERRAVDFTATPQREGVPHYLFDPGARFHRLWQEPVGMRYWSKPSGNLRPKPLSPDAQSRR